MPRGSIGLITRRFFCAAKAEYAGHGWHVQRFLLLPTVPTLILGALVLAGAAHAATADSSGTVGEVSLPGGLGAARAAIGDEIPPDRSLFLLEFIRRTYDTPLRITEPRSAVLQALLQV